MNCRGNCNQGRDECDSDCSDGEFYGLLLSLTVVLIGLLGFALWSALYA